MTRRSLVASICAGLVLLVIAVRGQDEHARASAVRPLPQAHAHNDYWHARPLFDALEHGFCSVEADVFLVGDVILVGHDRVELKTDRTLESLYLKPLLDRVRRNRGRVYPDGPEFTLLVDIKDDAEKTYEALHALLARYREMLTEVHDGELERRAVAVIISGNRPRELIVSQALRWAGIDGRLGDLDSEDPAHLVPLISDRWTSHFSWKGGAAITEDELAKLRSIVEKAHRAGRKIRFWAIPHDPIVWTTLRQVGVDLINTDDLKGLQRFFLTYRES